MCRHFRVLPRPKSLRGQAWRESSVVYYSHEGTTREFTTPLKKARTSSPRPLAGEGLGERVVDSRGGAEKNRIKPVAR
jgi:hypothetical protein